MNPTHTTQRALLTTHHGAAMLCPTGNKPVGICNPHRTGVQSPLNTVVFLCQKISASLKTPESFYYGVVIRGAERLAAPVRGIANPFKHATRLFAKSGGGYSLIRTGPSA